MCCLSPPTELSKTEKIAGDLAISVPTALRQAREQGHALSVEIKVLMLHGLLHLAGFDHERDTGQMARRERLLRGRLRLPQGLIERAAGLNVSAGKNDKERARRVQRKQPVRGGGGHELACHFDGGFAGPG